MSGKVRYLIHTQEMEAIVRRVCVLCIYHGWYSYIIMMGESESISSFHDA